ASESALPSTAPAEALHTFMLDSCASCYFFRDSTTLTPLTAPVPVRLADPSGGPVLAHSTTVLTCPAVPSGSLSGLHLPSFSTNLVSTAALQDVMVSTTTTGGQRVASCSCTRTGHHLATFTHRPGSSLYTLTTEPAQVATSGQVFASGHVAAPCSCRLLSHQTLLWHHRLGHPSLPRLRGMHSRLLVSGLPRSLPPLPPSPISPCLPCIEGRQRAAPRSSVFPLTTAPLQTLHMDVRGPTRVSGQGRERYFLLVVNDYTRYTTVFPLRSKGEVPDVLIPWIRAVRLQLRERFHQDLPVMRPHSDRGGEFSSDLLRDFCRGEGILQSLTLLASPQQNGIAERRIGLVMEVAHTSMIHATAPHFLWPFAVRYAAHQLNLWPRVSLPDTSTTLRWTGKVGDASVFWVWGSRAFVRATSADKLSSRTIPCIFLGFPPDAPGWQFYHPTSRHVLPSHESGPAPSGASQVDPLPLAEPVEVTVDFGAAGGGAGRGAACGGAEPAGADPGDAEPGSAEPESSEHEGAEPGGAETEGAEPGGPKSEGAESGGAEPRGTASSGGPAGASPQQSRRREPLSVRQLHEWFARRTRLRSGSAGPGCPAAGGIGAGGAGATSPGGSGVTIGAGGPRGAGAAGPGGARTRGTGAAGVGGTGAGGTRAGGAGAGDAGTGGAGAGGAGAGGAGAGGAGAGGAGAGGAGAGGTGAGGAGARDPGAGGAGARGGGAGGTDSSLPAPSPYAEQTDSLTERGEHASRPASPVRAVRIGPHVPRPRPPPVPGTHIMVVRPSSIPLRVPLPSPPASSLADGPDPESDLVCAASPTVTRLLATVVTDPSFESAAASALVAELSDCPLSIGGECALGTDVFEDRQKEFECVAAAVLHLVAMLLALKGDPDAPDILTPRSYAEAITGPYSSQWQTAINAEMASWKCTGTYVNAIPTSGANIVDGMWIFRVKRPPGSLPVFKARYVARGFSQRQGVDFFQTFSPTPKMTTLWVMLHVAPQRDYKLHSLDFNTTFLQGSLHEEIWLRRPPSFIGTTLAALGFAPSSADPSLFLRTNTSLLPFYVLVYVDDLVFATADTEALALVNSELQKRHTCTDLGKLRSYLGSQITRDRARRTITLTQSHMVHQVLQRFGFRYSSPQSTPLPTRQSLSAPPSDESVEPSGLYSELVGCLMYVMTCTRPELAYPLSILAHYVATGRHRTEHWEAALDTQTRLALTTWLRNGRHRVTLSALAPVLFLGGLPAHLPFSVPVVRLFTPSSANHSLFMLGEGEQRSFMVVYVDDILILPPSSDLVKEVMLKIQDKFKCKALGDVSFYLGLHIERDVEKWCMRVHQRKYLEALAANFVQIEGYVATPFPSGFKCVKGPEEESVGEEERRRFHSLVGSLMYAAVNTRPDVAFATGQLARGADGVEPERWFLTAFSDASYASD
ncbi:unnamed protein product, partial [Closterium sp. NIES-53]